MEGDLPDALVVPICPPADEPPVAAFLRKSGWPDGAGSLPDTAVWLQSQDIDSGQDFIGLGDIDELPGAVLLTAEARSFLQTLVRARLSLHAFMLCQLLQVACLQDEAVCMNTTVNDIRLEQLAVGGQMER